MSPDSNLGIAAEEYDKFEVIRVGLADHDVISTIEGTIQKKVSNKKVCERITRRGGVKDLVPCLDLLDYDNFTKMKDAIAHERGCSIHGSLPCTACSLMQNLNIAVHGESFTKKNNREKRKGRLLLRRFLELAEEVLSNGGHMSFEWPGDCYGWLEGNLIRFTARWDLYVVDFHGCAVGYKHPVTNQSFLKPDLSVF